MSVLCRCQPALECAIASGHVPLLNALLHMPEYNLYRVFVPPAAAAVPAAAADAKSGDKGLRRSQETEETRMSERGAAGSVRRLAHYGFV